MRIFYDTEFIEDGKTIDLISIGMVAENGDEYYAISREFDSTKASEWVCENVLSHLPLRWKVISPDVTEECADYKWRTEIRDEVQAFVLAHGPKVEMWGYYADYDHVVLCQLFGTMMDLPRGFPMYTRDIKQLCVSLGDPKLPEQGKGEHHALLDARWNQIAYEFLVELEGKPSE